MGLTFVITSLIMIVISYIDNGKNKDTKGIELSKNLFKTSSGFNITSIIILLTLIFIYTTLW